MRHLSPYHPRAATEGVKNRKTLVTKSWQSNYVCHCSSHSYILTLKRFTWNAFFWGRLIHSFVDSFVPSLIHSGRELSRRPAGVFCGRGQAQQKNALVWVQTSTKQRSYTTVLKLVGHETQCFFYSTISWFLKVFMTAKSPRNNVLICKQYTLFQYSFIVTNGYDYKLSNKYTWHAHWTVSTCLDILRQNEDS